MIGNNSKEKSNNYEGSAKTVFSLLSSIDLFWDYLFSDENVLPINYNFLDEENNIVHQNILIQRLFGQAYYIKYSQRITSTNAKTTEEVIEFKFMPEDLVLGMVEIAHTKNKWVTTTKKIPIQNILENDQIAFNILFKLQTTLLVSLIIDCHQQNREIFDPLVIELKKLLSTIYGKDSANELWEMGSAK